MPLIAGPSSSPVINRLIEPAGVASSPVRRGLREIWRPSPTKAAIALFISVGAAAEQRAVDTMSPANGSRSQSSSMSHGRHHIGMPGEAEIGSWLCPAAHRGWSTSSSASRAEQCHRADRSKPKRFEQHCATRPSAPGIDRCDAGAADQRLRQRDRVARHIRLVVRWHAVMKLMARHVCDSVAQQLVDRGLRAGLLVDALDDHRAVQVWSWRSVGERRVPGRVPWHHHRIGRHPAGQHLAAEARSTILVDAPM